MAPLRTPITKLISFIMGKCVEEKKREARKLSRKRHPLLYSKERARRMISPPLVPEIAALRF